MIEFNRFGMVGLADIHFKLTGKSEPWKKDRGIFILYRIIFKHCDRRKIYEDRKERRYLLES